MSFPLFKLSSICEIQIGKTPSRSVPEYWNDGIHPWLSIADMNQGKFIEFTKEKITNKGVKDSNIKLIPQGTLLLSYKLSIGKIGFTKIPIYTNEAIAALTCLRSDVFIGYLYWALKSLNLAEEADRAAMGATLNKAKLQEIKIPLPPLEEQRRIAAILDKAEALRAKRREAIAKLDLLLQSVFLEMFGDPISNPKNFLVRNLTDFYFDPKEGTRCGPFGSALKKSDITEDGVPLWNMDNISLNGEMIMPFSAYVSFDKAKDLNSYCVEDGDILISRAGTVGKMCVVRGINKKSLITTNLIRLRFNKDLIPEFFIYLMIYNKGKIGRLQVGPDGAFTHMSTGILDSISFPYPPLGLQEKWVNIRNTIISKKNIFLEQLKSIEKFQQALSIDLFK